MASSKSWMGITQTTGPKISSCAMRIFHHDDDVLSAHFQAAMLKIGSAGFRYDAPHFRRSRKTDYRHVTVLRQRSANRGAAAAYEVKHAARHTRFSEHLHQVINR